MNIIGYFFQKKAFQGLLEKKGTPTKNFGGGGSNDPSAPPHPPLLRKACIAFLIFLFLSFFFLPGTYIFNVPGDYKFFILLCKLFVINI